MMMYDEYYEACDGDEEMEELIREAIGDEGICEDIEAAD